LLSGSLEKLVGQLDFVTQEIQRIDRQLTGNEQLVKDLLASEQVQQLILSE